MTQPTAAPGTRGGLARKVKATLVGGVEAAASIALVLACFLAFTVLLFASFPAGSELGELLASVRPQERAIGGGARLDDTGHEVWRDLVASVSSIQRSVKSKPADSIAWMDARPGLALANRDAVQTFDRSLATISFETPNELRLGENSLLVMRDAEQEKTTAQTRATVVLVEGEMRGAVASRGPRAMDLEVLVGAATAHITSPEHGPARFRMAASPTSPSIVSVFEGRAAVSSAQGTVSVGPNMYVALYASGAMSAPRALPAVPESSAPADAEVRSFRRAEAEVRFSWSEPEPSDTFHLVVATDPKFESVVYDGRARSPEFVHGHLKPGRYYWHVSAERDGAESDFSPARRLDLTRDDEPPVLRVDFPGPDAEQEQVVIRGETEPGATVFFAGEPVAVDADGRFEVPVDLQRGVNLLVIEAVDAAGNFAYASRMVTATFETTKRSS